MKKITHIVVHCSDSDWGCAREIRKWHQKRGWRTIGYHFVIQNGRPTYTKDLSKALPALDGAIECGRYLDDDPFISRSEVGAHTLGLNAVSIGICLIGKKVFSPYQKLSLNRLLINLMMLHEIDIKNILGHYETESGAEQGKTCPNFDMAPIRAELTRWGKYTNQT